MTRHLFVLVLAACSGGAREVAPGARGSGNAAASAGAASASADMAAAAAAAPCPPPPPLDCADGFEVAWDGPERASHSAGVLLTRAGVSTLLWSPRHGTGSDAVDRGVIATRACGDAGTDVALPGSDASYLVDAAASATVTAVVGLLPGAVMPHRYGPSTLLLWLDRGAGFGAPVTLSDSLPRGVPVETAAGADGSIAIVWSDGDRDALTFLRVEPDGALARPVDLGRVPYGMDGFRLVALPTGGWILVQAGRSARRITATHLAADGTPGRPHTLVEVDSKLPPTGPINAGIPGGFAVTWDGEAIAIAYETGDYGREASTPSFGHGRSTEPVGTIGWSAQPDSHDTRFLRVAPDLTPLAPPVILDRDADVDRPAALVHHAGHYFLLGASMSPTRRAGMSPQLVRFTATGAITHRIPLPIPTHPWLATLAAQGSSLRGTLTVPDLRAFTLRCAAP